MNNGTYRETIEFDPNMPVQVALKYQTGRAVQGNNGPRVMYTTTDNRVFFLDEDVAERINDMRPRVGEPFTICRRKSGRAVEWEVSRLGQQQDGTYAVPRNGAGAGAGTPAPVNASTNQTTNNNGNSSANGNAPAPQPPNIHQGWALLLLSQTNAMTDVFAAALQYAAKHAGAVKPEDVRTMLVTSFIELSKRRPTDVA